MHALYNFHFLNTVSEQLFAQLQGISDSPLTEATLNALELFQQANSADQGVYVLHHQMQPVYVGKAANMRARLQKHRNKISGRKGINLADVSYKALLLDKSMSTAANETVLMDLFQQKFQHMWNNGGFGPNDPGQERDTTKPGYFDSTFPIQEKWSISLTPPVTTVGELLRMMKEQLPYVFRYQRLTPAEAQTAINVAGIPPEADALFEAAVLALGTGWKGAILSYGMVLYKNNKTYPYASKVFP